MANCGFDCVGVEMNSTYMAVQMLGCIRTVWSAPPVMHLEQAHDLSCLTLYPCANCIWLLACCIQVQLVHMLALTVKTCTGGVFLPSTSTRDGILYAYKCSWDVYFVNAPCLRIVSILFCEAFVCVKILLKTPFVYKVPTPVWIQRLCTIFLSANA